MRGKRNGLILLILLFGLTLPAQNDEQGYPFDSLKTILQDFISYLRKEAKTDSLVPNEILQKAADYQAEYMAGIETPTTEGKGKYGSTGERIKAFGGGDKGEELVMAIGISKGKEMLDVKDAAKYVTDKWYSQVKIKDMIVRTGHVFIGIAVKPDAKMKKAYLSVVFGDYSSFNQGAEKRKELAVPYSTKEYKLKPSEGNADKDCKRCDRFKELNELQKGLYVDNGKVYMKYRSVKELRKLLRRGNDGFAVDIVQRAQYDNPDYNIYNNELVSKGVLLKKVKSKKVFKRNREKPNEKGKVVAADIYMGKFPKEITGDYEMNLLVIQNGKVCRNLSRSYVENTEQESSTQLEMLYQPESIPLRTPPFVPKAESVILNFVVPFEKNKYDYKAEDVQPMLNALQEPDFIIDGLYIYAYSSIEGDSVSNAKLQKKRGESIIEAMKSLQKEELGSSNVVTNDSWGLFTLEMEDSPFGYLTQLPKKEAIKKINENKSLLDSLEPYLSKQRFAEIVMDITYDISGAKEEKYTVIQFNRAVKSQDINYAYKIQDYIQKKVKEKNYTAEATGKMEIPLEAKNQGLLLNQVVYEYEANNKQATGVHWSKLKELEKKFPDNLYIRFNSLLCEVTLGDVPTDDKNRRELQKRIDELYKLKFPKDTVDALNIEYQFRIMASVDTIEGSEPIVEECINRIKSFYNFEDGSWQNALKVAYQFMRFHDYDYAASLLASHIDKPDVSEQMVFTFISACANSKDRVKTMSFVKAMRKAKQMNPERYCKLFGQPFLTFQVLDNLLVKKDYHEAGCR